MPITQGQRNFLIALGIAAGGYALYKVSKGEKVEEAVKEPIAAVVAATETVKKKLIKGSPEAKEHMRKLLSMRKTAGRKKKEKIPDSKPSEDHKGHETKQGLAQDQKLESKEPHEKKYRKSKKAKK